MVWSEIFFLLNDNSIGGNKKLMTSLFTDISEQICEAIYKVQNYTETFCNNNIVLGRGPTTLT